MAVRTPPTDEDIWVVPAAWWSKTDPFRGRWPARRIAVNAAAAQTVSDKLAQSADRIRAILSHSASHKVLAERGARYLEDRRADPLGAAVCAAIGMDAMLWDADALGRYYDDHADLADYLVATHGLGCAVATVAALSGICAEASDTWGGQSNRLVVSRPCDPPATLVRRLRTLLAAAGEMDYADALDQARQLRRGPLSIRLLTSYLFPTEQDWVTNDLADPKLTDGFGSIFLLASVTDSAHAHRILDLLGWHWHLLRDNKSLIYSVAAHLGADAASVLTRLWEAGQGNSSAPGPETLSRILAHLPADEAMDFLAGHSWRNVTAAALLASTERFPARAMRVLGTRTAQQENAADFCQHVRRHPELAVAMRDELPESAQQLITESLPEEQTVDTTPAQLVPAILSTPPWQRPPRKPVAAVALEVPGDIDISWLDGEREKWLDTVGTLSEDEIRERLERIPPGNDFLNDWTLDALAQVDFSIAEPYLRTSTVGWGLWSATPLLALTAKHGAATHDLVIDTVTKRPRDHADAIAPFESPAAAELVVDWLRLRSRRRIALDWLRRHPVYAATAFIPGAIGKARKARRTHAAALRTLVTLGYTDAVIAAAAAYDATAAVRELLDTDPAEIVPARIPVLPQWLSISELPAIGLADGHALPPGAVADLVTLMMMSEPGAPHAALARVRDDCDASSLAAAAGAIHSQWTRAGAPSKDTWVWEALAALGNDETVDELLPNILWNGAKDNALDTLAAIGTDHALSALITLHEKGRNAAVRDAAQTRVTDVADELGLSEDQLADRLVPDLGLRPDGTALLDFGSRQFVLGFDEQLRPTITGTDGTRYKALPKAGVHDDEYSAADANATYRSIRKSVKKFAADQIRRLERAMVTERRFTLDELRTLFIAHPVRINVTRRLIWATYRDGQVLDSFRIAEDNTFADADDATLEVAEDVVVGIAHPLHLGTELTAAWADVLADYELLQPFSQIAREVHHPDPELLASSSVPTPANATVPLGRIHGLTNRGWNPPERGDGGRIDTFDKRLPNDRVFSIGIDPGMEPFDSVAPVHELRYAALTGHNGPTFADLSPVTVSEILRDLAWLCGPH
ncbi:DUF4132 domain-containing protein [Nocardia vinacea]|uniref:DUF4132 domain-containing protein n=1 Tax=Nocardia vinacea TaxID=96468 RepID=A0ABZ1YZF2_9NOCA|nr:DUF4132 domain-containing protein [Nocardia vinacea]